MLLSGVLTNTLMVVAVILWAVLVRCIERSTKRQV